IALTLVRWVVILLLFFNGISLIYYFGPSIKKRFKWFSAGSSTATVFSIMISLAFTFYVNNFGQYNKLYGSIGTLFVIMLWFYLNAMVLLIGFELNSGIAVIKARAGSSNQ
ncbi:MAG: YihY/virulence factor BrkB family protein, partial [Bacteroidetes bacterium]|nr:YihY/virulence factor BrkB family protein [Bacteroidota bacterium]